jgi:hypothetical protein
VKKFSDFIKKSAEPQKKEPASNVIKGRFKIAKSDDDKHLAFGWANVAIRADGEEIEDWQEDIIEPEELENAAYQYVLLYREGGECTKEAELQSWLNLWYSRKKKCRQWDPGRHSSDWLVDRLQSNRRGCMGKG